MTPSVPKHSFDPDNLRGDYSSFGGWTFMLDPGLTGGAVWVSNERQVAAVPPEFWRALKSHMEAFQLFTENIMNGNLPNGISQVPTEGLYAEAAHAHAVASGDNVVMAKDAITQMTEQAQALVREAMGVIESATPGQMQIFIERYFAVTAGLTELEGKMAELRAMQELAAAAVMGARE